MLLDLCLAVSSTKLAIFGKLAKLNASGWEVARDIAAAMSKTPAGNRSAENRPSVSLPLRSAPRTGSQQRTADELDWDRRFLGRPA
jgi:hypothetical protein